MGRAQRNPSLRHRIDGFRFALPILHSAHARASHMAIHAPAHTVAVLTASFAFLAAVNTAALASDGVSLSESTISWSTVNYATSAENGFVDGSLDKRTIVDRTFKTHVLE